MSCAECDGVKSPSGGYSHQSPASAIIVGAVTSPETNSRGHTFTGNSVAKTFHVVPIAHIVPLASCGGLLFISFPCLLSRLIVDRRPETV